MKKLTALLVFFVLITTITKAQTHDLGVAEILPQQIYYGDSAKIFPTIKIHNYGTSDEVNFEVEVIINDGSEDVYTFNGTIQDNITTGSDLKISMPIVWTITNPELTYTINATVTLAGDENSGNNSVNETPTITQLTYTRQNYAFFNGNTGNKYLLSFDQETGDQEIHEYHSNIYSYHTAAEFVNGVFYGLNSKVAEKEVFIMAMDEDNDGNITHTKNVIGNYYGLPENIAPSGFTYDYDNNIMYLITYSDVYKMHDCNLYTLNMQTFEATLVGNINGATDAQFFDIEYANGKLYAIEVIGRKLWEINPETGEGTPKNVTLASNWMELDHFLSYDRTTETMYATLTINYEPYFCTIDLETGAKTVVQYYPSSENAPYMKMFAMQASAYRNITSFQIPNQVGETVIDNENHTITVNMPYGTNVTNLIPEIEITENAQGIFPTNGMPRNFSDPVEYTVTGKFNQEQIWTVTVNNIMSDINNISQNSFNIYPNPSNGIFTLDLKTSVGLLNVSITNITGKRIYNSIINNKLTNINLTNQTSGIYFINILYTEHSQSKIETKNYTRKLIIK